MGFAFMSANSGAQAGSKNSNNSPCTRTKTGHGTETWGRPWAGAALTGRKSDGQSSARKMAYGEETGVVTGGETGAEIMTLSKQYRCTVAKNLLCQHPGLPCSGLL